MTLRVEITGECEVCGTQWFLRLADPNHPNIGWDSRGRVTLPAVFRGECVACASARSAS